MKNKIVILCLILVGFLGYSQEVKNKNAKIVTEVNGNCEHCQKRIQKAAYSVSGVKSAIWNVETHQLSLFINEEKTNVLAVKNAIANSGHDTDVVKAKEEIYKKLPNCCLYDRK